MRIKPSLVIAVMIAISAVCVTAQKTTKFTSSYTNLSGKACKFYPGGEGQDGMSLCKGPGKYQVRIYSSATMTHIVAELKGTDNSYSLASVSLDFNQARSNVEWRLANGVPFAAIFRAPTYGEPNEFGGPGKKTGEQLVVVGLKGHDDIEATIDAKTPNANAKAREAADTKFWKKD
ncbi:MAG TPA: hypothetical protein PLP21_01780 [Pyrinomonadaceae bacterium]|nr:hypothetical protein [Acidobacteriota bacterium]HQZ95013.1 hypothetical protein [Pyrinomonadaceae bacterium]